MEPSQLDVTPTWVPAACTLPTIEQPLRVAELDALISSSVSAVRRADVLRLELSLPAHPETVARAARLAVQESSCCAFFTFRLTIGAGDVTLEIAVDAPHVAVLDALGAQAEQLVTEHRGRG